MRRSLVSLIFILSLGCGEKNGAFLQMPEALRSEAYLVVASGDNNHASVTLFTLEGQYINRLIDFLDIGGLPRGLAILDPTQLIVASEYVDSLYTVNLSGERDGFYVGNLYAGNIYDIAKDSKNNVYAVESNAIEKFDPDGNRIGNPYQSGNLGICQINGPRNIFVSSDDRLFIANSGGSDQVSVLDVSGDSPTCVTSLALGNNPYGIIQHTNGYVYVSTQGDDQIWRLNEDLSNPTVIWSTDLTVLRDPSAIVEMPDGTIAVASSYTDSIELFTPEGERVQTSPFLKTPDTLNITDMLIWEPE